MEATDSQPDTPNSAVPPRPTETEDNLTDDKTSPGPDFKGATLELGTVSQNGNDPGVTFAGMPTAVDPNFDRNARPGSTISRRSTTSTGSKASLSATKRETTYTVKQYFSKKVDI